MKRVHAPDGVRNAFGDRPTDPRGHVGGDQFDLFAALLAQRVEERQHRLAVLAGCGPHQPAGVMVDHDGEVSLSLAVADLIDPDPPQPVEQIDLAHGLSGDPLEDRADRPPRDAHQLRDRGLRRVHRQPRDLVLKRAGEPRTMPRPRHRADHHTVTPVAHPRCLSLNERERRSKVKRAPAPASLAEIQPGAAAPAHTTAIPLAPPRPGRNDHLPLAAHPHVLNHRSAQPNKPRPYPDTTHVASPPRDSSRRTAGNPRSRAACAPSSAAHPTHGNVRSALINASGSSGR